MREQRIPYLFVLPAVVLVAGIVAYPFFQGIYLSFHRLEISFIGLLEKPRFIYFDNYIRMLHDPVFWLSVKNTFVWVVVTVSGQFLLGLALALLLKQNRLRGFLSGVALVPWAIPTVAVGIVWRWILDPVGGHLNMLLLGMHLIKEPILFLDSEQFVWPCLFMISIWRNFPFMFVTFLAGLIAIPVQLYEAAKIDGAGPLSCFIYITLPSLKTIITIVVLLQLIYSWNGFDIVYVVTGGGPGFKTMIMSPFIYFTALTYGHVGYAASAGAIMIMGMIVFAILYFRLAKAER